MKKIVTVFIVIASVFSAVFAYNPPAGGENLFEYSSPDLLSGKTSVTGGALFSARADSLVINPALAAGEQRVNLNAAYTLLHSLNQENKYGIGNAFQVGILIPLKMFTFTGYFNGTMIPFDEMSLGNSFNLKAGLSKEITDKLDVGLSLNTGVIFKNGVDWALSGNLGFNYYYGDLAFLKDFRYGASILNLGKNYERPASIGIQGDYRSSHYPTIATIKAGASATVFANDSIDVGVALDLTTPLFQNLLVDLSSQILIQDKFYINVNERLNIAEMINNHASAIPAISFGFRFPLSINSNQYLTDNGWNESEMTVSLAYRNLYSTVNAISAGVDVDLGLEDTTPPEIIFIDDDEE